MQVRLSNEVQSAAAQGKAIVALESTIIAHGMPFPDNLQMAQQVEDLVRQRGATPATIAVVDGELRAGLEASELEHFARTGPDIMKVSTRDLPFVVARTMTGATTVASTMRIAALAGISVFATGGMGGAHRGAEKDFDISADLMEFATSNVAVVTSGAKAILDLADPASPIFCGVVYHRHWTSPVSGSRDSRNPCTSSESPPMPTMTWFLMTMGAGVQKYCCRTSAISLCQRSLPVAASSETR